MAVAAALAAMLGIAITAPPATAADRLVEIESGGPGPERFDRV